jgi:hypothetical protein
MPDVDHVAPELGSLALCAVRPRVSALSLRAARWHADLIRLGISLPFGLVRDLGLLLAVPHEQLEFGARASSLHLDAKMRDTLAAYERFVSELENSDVVKRASELGLTDDLVSALLAYLLAKLVRGRNFTASPLPFDARLFDQTEQKLLEFSDAEKLARAASALNAINVQALCILTLVDTLNPGSLELFGMLGGDAIEGALAQVDIVSILGTPEAHDVVDFSLEILPQVLEKKRAHALTTHAAQGYAGLSRKGSPDSMMLTELAWDEAEFARRLADDELLYYAHDQARDELGRVHYFLIDASASMRGQRATFARGTALAAAKKLLLAKEEVVFRFFDARLYEARACRGGKLPLSHILSFQGERGRNPARVFREVITMLDAAHARDKREPWLHVFSHGALQIPRDNVEKIAHIAKFSAVFSLPSQTNLKLDYLDLLHAHWVVDYASLANRTQRAENAAMILNAVGEGA